MTVQKLEMYESLLQQKIINTDASRVNLVLQNRNFQNALSQQNSWIPVFGDATIRERKPLFTSHLRTQATPPKCVPAAQPDPWQGMREKMEDSSKKSKPFEQPKINQKKNQMAYLLGSCRDLFCFTGFLFALKSWRVLTYLEVPTWP